MIIPRKNYNNINDLLLIVSIPNMLIDDVRNILLMNKYINGGHIRGTCIEIIKKMLVILFKIQRKLATLTC